MRYFPTFFLIFFCLCCITNCTVSDNTSLDGLTPEAYLPAFSIIPSPEPYYTPELENSNVEAFVQVLPDGHLLSSTFEPGAFIIRNSNNHTHPISKVRIDLSSALLPDLVFDPFGAAGDTVAKDLTIDNDGSTHYSHHRYFEPHDNGFDVLEIYFNSFSPGERVAFSVDVDPTSIRGVGAPGPFDSGSVSGLELVGATIAITYDNGIVLTGQLYRVSENFGGAELWLREVLPASPTLSIHNQDTPATVSEANQLVYIEGTPYQTVKVLVVEGGLFTDGLPGGGFDIDPYEANTALTLREYAYTINPLGWVYVPITLSRSHAQGGLNYIIVVEENNYAYTGMTTSPVVLELTP